MRPGAAGLNLARGLDTPVRHDRQLANPCNYVFESTQYIARPIRAISISPGGSEMKIESLRDLFEIELCYTYDCEQKLVKKGLPTMIENSTTPELRSALEQHLQETRNHVARLEQVFSIIGADAKAKDNDVL